MTNPDVAYFFKKFYRNIIKWWYVIYNPIARVISFSKEDEEYTKKLQHEKKVKQIEREMKMCKAQGIPYTGITLDELEQQTCDEQADEQTDEQFVEEPRPIPETQTEEIPTSPSAPVVKIDDVNYNQTTGAFSGLYGTAPMDESTQSVLDEIMGKNKPKNSIESLFEQESISNTPTTKPVEMPPDQEEIMKEADEIFARLQREAAEDEAKKQAEIEAVKAAAGIL